MIFQPMRKGSLDVQSYGSLREEDFSLGVVFIAIDSLSWAFAIFSHVSQIPSFLFWINLPLIIQFFWGDLQVE